jgi:hypothetical protein
MLACHLTQAPAPIIQSRWSASGGGAALHDRGGVLQGVRASPAPRYLSGPRIQATSTDVWGVERVLPIRSRASSPAPSLCLMLLASMAVRTIRHPQAIVLKGSEAAGARPPRYAAVQGGRLRLHLYGSLLRVGAL